EITLLDREGNELACTSQHLVFAPAKMQRWGDGRSVWVYDPIGVADGIEERLEAAGFKIVDTPEKDTLGIVTFWDAEANKFVQEGGRAILAALHPKSLTIASGLGMRLLDRTM